MTVLALRMAASSNGVSKLHGKVSRKMWKAIWPGVPEDEIPIGSVTNGVHFRSWISARDEPALRPLPGPASGARSTPTPSSGSASRPFPPRSCGAPTSGAASAWWPSRARAPARRSCERRGASQAEIDAADEVLDPDALTIGFARRFATYKRATLLLRDPERLAPHPQRPAAARADHLRRQGPPARRRRQGPDPADRASWPQRPEFRRRMVFLEDYDMAVARYLVQGCGRVAEHAAAPAGSQRHQRHEGRSPTAC